MVISYLRLKAITDPFNSRSDNFSNREYMKLVLTWCMCLVISLPTASINKVETIEDGKLICANTSWPWGSTDREIYYTVHAILFLIIPLIYMIVTQRKIFRSLQANVIPSTLSRVSSTQIKDIRKLQRHFQLYLLPSFRAILRLWFLDCWCILT